MPSPRMTKIRRRVYEVLELGRGEDRHSILVENAIILLIVLNVVAVYPRNRARYRGRLL